MKKRKGWAYHPPSFLQKSFFLLSISTTNLWGATEASIIKKPAEWKESFYRH